MRPPSPAAGAPPALCAAVFLSSLSTLGFEVLLLRVFSVVLWHHFAAMVVSVSMLGLAAGGTAAAARWALFRSRPLPRPSLFLALGFAITGSYLLALRIPFDPIRLAWDWRQTLLLSAYYLVLAVPFFFGGLIMTSVFVAAGERVGQVYAADLCGAAAGALIVLPLQSALSPGQAVLFFSLTSFAAAAAAGGGVQRAASAGLALAAGLAAAAAPGAMEAEVSPYKALPTLLRMQGAATIDRIDGPYGRVDLFSSPGVRSAPGLSLAYRGELPPQLGLSVDGSSVTTVSPPGGQEGGSWLESLPASLAFGLRGGGKVLLVESRGGVSAALARRAGAESVSCIEGNPSVAAILKRSVPGALDLCSHRLERSMPRTFLARDRERYDLVDLPLGGTISSSGPLGGGEDYGLTVEAFVRYLSRLEEDGVLNVSLFINPPYRSELRVFATVLEALDRLGAADPPSQVFAFRSLEVCCFVVRRTPFTASERDWMRDRAASLWFDPLWYRGMAAGEAGVHIRTTGDDLAAAMASLADPQGRASFIEGYPFDISPVGDDRPYFHDHLRLSTLDRIWRRVDGKWDFFVTEGYLLPLALLQAGALGVLLVLLPAAAAGGRSVKGRANVFLYFSLLGAGYMLVEVVMIQRMTVPLGHPLHAAAGVLGALLVASGAGSWVSRAWSVRRLPLQAAGASVLVLALLLGGNRAGGLVGGLDGPWRFAAAAVLLFPPGFVMGTLFPGGLRALAGGRERLIPWAWAMNGFFSVTAPLAAVMVASRWGFGAVLAAGALCYLGASVAGAGLCASPTMGTKRTPPI